MKDLILICLVLFSTKAFSCSPPEYVPVPDKCKGKTNLLNRKLIDISTDFPKGIVTQSENEISFKIENHYTIDCLEEYPPEWHWIKPYRYKNTKYYRSCHITMSAVCDSRSEDKMDWDCSTSPDTCGHPQHPLAYVIKPDDFKQFDSEALKVLNTKVHSFDRAELRRFALTEKDESERFLKFKVRWTFNPDFKKECEKYKDGF